METVNTNIVTASKVIRRALQIADLSNTDFLSYEELTENLNSAWKNVYNTIIQYNLNVFTVEAQLVDANGVYQLPFDCYEIKSVRNPISGANILRRSESESVYGPYYEIVNNTIRLGRVAGPVTITYWRKPFWLSIPNKKIDTNFTEEVLDTCINSVLWAKNDLLHITNLLSDSTLETSVYKIDLNTYKLGNNFILELGPVTAQGQLLKVYDFSGNVIYEEENFDKMIVKSNDGLLYFAELEENKAKIYNIGENEPFYEMDYTAIPENIICIDEEFYSAPVDSCPIGTFDGRAAYTNKTSLFLIDYNEINGVVNRVDIEEKLHIPSIGNKVHLNYGILTFDGTLYSNIPDTALNLPNNIYYDCISYDLAVRFLCKQNADSSGVENLNKNAWQMLTNSIDQSSDFQRIRNVRR